MNTIICLASVRESRVAVDKYRTMDKLALMEAMVGYQERTGRFGEMPSHMIPEGIALFGALYDLAETDEMKLLCSSYCRHLKSMAILRRMQP